MYEYASCVISGMLFSDMCEELSAHMCACIGECMMQQPTATQAVGFCCQDDGSCARAVRQARVLMLAPWYAAGEPEVARAATRAARRCAPTADVAGEAAPAPLRSRRTSRKATPAAELADITNSGAWSWQQQGECGKGVAAAPLRTSPAAAAIPGSGCRGLTINPNPPGSI